MIRIEKLNKYFNKSQINELHVLKDLDFSLESNSYISIMGTSGVGKSTLLNIIGGIEAFDSGTYLFEGIDMFDIKENELDKIRGKKITFVFQEYLLVEEESVIENVKTPLYFDNNIKYKDMDKLAEEAILKVGLDKTFFEKKCSLLSGGQKQRVAIARSIVNKPILLLADEPTGALDEESSEEILQLFRKLVSENLSIIIVTHDKEVAQHTDKIYVMKDGKIKSFN